MQLTTAGLWEEAQYAALDAGTVQRPPADVVVDQTKAGQLGIGCVCVPAVSAPLGRVLCMPRLGH